MALRSRFLVDKSALMRINQKAVEDILRPLLNKRCLDTCAVVDLEVFYSARSPKEYDNLVAHRRTYYTNLPMTQEIAARALEVQARLVKRSQHRGCGAEDLLIAACAETYRVPLLHYDKDFDLIASVTGQATQWVVPRGEVP